MAAFARVALAGCWAGAELRALFAGAAGGAEAAGACPEACSRFISRAFRRAALLRCSTPLATARSSAEIATTTSWSMPSAPSAMPRRNLVTLVLTADLIDRFR
ncbi:MAG TPA: hypothetical protein VE953_26310 [Terriglobales bacterium]|nr:hypothetical protein [Terriglobales bacterium]